MKKTDYHENAENWIADAMREHQAPLVRYVARLVGGDFDRAQDVVQDAFLRLCQQPEYAVRDHVVEWLYTVCRNRAVDVMRKEGRMLPCQLRSITRRKEKLILAVAAESSFCCRIELLVLESDSTPTVRTGEPGAAMTAAPLIRNRARRKWGISKGEGYG